jgi:hypothetical protein
VLNIKYGINLIRNPLSARNPGVSLRRFETPPPPTLKCCLAMFLETYVRDCLSTCRAPAVCLERKSIASYHLIFATIVMSSRLSAQSPSSYPPLGSSPLTTSRGLVEDAGHCLRTSESWVQPERKRPCLLLVWSVRSNRVGPTLGGGVGTGVCCQEGHTRSTGPLVPRS